MRRSCAYADEVFGLGRWLAALTDSRTRPRIPAAAAIVCGLILFVTRRGGLSALEQGLRIPGRLRGPVGPRPPSVDSVGRTYAGMDSPPLRRDLADVAHRLKRDKAPMGIEGRYVAAIDGRG